MTGQNQEPALAERHAVLFECLLQEPQRLRPDAMRLGQLGGRHVREPAEPGIPGRGQRAGCRCPDIAGKTCIQGRYVPDSTCAGS